MSCPFFARWLYGSNKYAVRRTIYRHEACIDVSVDTTVSCPYGTTIFIISCRRVTAIPFRFMVALMV
jgi:hypothetical protein